MNKWEVYRCSFPNGRRRWCAMTRADYWSDRYFDTHAEAMKYADARARTVEVNLLNVADRLSFAPWRYWRDSWYAVDCGRYFLAPANKTENHVAVLCSDYGEQKIYYDEALKLAQGLLSFAASQRDRIINEQGQEGSGRG
ncbi:hypothetical protein [Corynebacterium sp. p3-SID1194]|uniref:hypothetical protein n=1 Tax=Corynebacterium sp. p3-SID1194 TaxID=2916105 RepID=UPI0021A3D630|nr:hypothetical protein [Corynebacterium sp. p3-SID1194]MCT1450631.1 hypothetical protein [Corynebacterium sp. p3-SID1194]